MKSSQILLLRNHLMRQSEEQRQWLIAEGFKLGDEDIAMRIRAKMETALRSRATASSPLSDNLRALLSWVNSIGPRQE